MNPRKLPALRLVFGPFSNSSFRARLSLCWS
jgi:hypothetical protein